MAARKRVKPPAVRPSAPEPPEIWLPDAPVRGNPSRPSAVERLVNAKRREEELREIGLAPQSRAVPAAGEEIWLPDAPSPGERALRRISQSVEDSPGGAYRRLSPFVSRTERWAAEDPRHMEHEERILTLRGPDGDERLGVYRVAMTWYGILRLQALLYRRDKPATAENWREALEHSVTAHRAHIDAQAGEAEAGGFCKMCNAADCWAVAWALRELTEYKKDRDPNQAEIPF